MVRKRTFRSILRQIFSTKKSRIEKSQRILTDWETMYKDLQTHPLTQAKIINEQLLATTNDSLKRVNKRLDDFDDRIEKLEQRRIKVIRKVQNSPAEEAEEVKPEKGQKKMSPAQIVKKVVADPHMSDQEKEIVKHIQAQNESDAQTIAEQFHISRSNASLKLNKLHDWGFLSKQMKDKTVFYRIKGD